MHHFEPKKQRMNRMILERELAELNPEQKIDLVKNWAHTRESFDLSFIDSLGEYWDEYGELTEKQEGALDTIILRYRIDIPTFK